MKHEAEPRRYWFRAKRYGWGWTPATWQGWVFTLGWLATTLPMTFWLANQNIGMAYAFMSIMIVVLAVVCFMKGEPPRWRWGG